MKTQNINLPIVQFQYPDSNTNSLRIRIVECITKNDDYITGYEIQNNKVKTKVFKKYSLKRIVANGISLISWNI